MSHRLEVLPGAGTVVRHGDVAVWAGPPSSAALLSFLVQSARNVSGSARSGVQIVDHIAGILATRDPEPGAPFAVIGPSTFGWVTLLHGPVQLWDGTRWLAPTPTPGWLRSDVAPRPAVAIGPAGGASPRLAPDSPYDLQAGTVPGGGLLLVPDGGAADPVTPSRGYGGTATPASAGAPAVRSAASAPRPATAVAPAPDGRAPGATPSTRLPVGGAGRAGPSLAAAPESAPVGAALWTSLLDAGTPARASLPIGEAATPPGRPQVTGARCTEGHLNPPGAPVCAGCARPVAGGQPPATGPRPVLGVLVAADDGETFRLDVDQVLGSDPTTDQGVAGGRLRGVVLTGAPGQLAPAHAEIRLDDWNVAVIDRGSAAGTFVVPAGTTDWVRLTPYEPVTLQPGSHLSIGQRVLTYLSPWPG